MLLQQGKGADLSVFGGGGTMTAFGARGAASLLHKMTVAGFVGYIIIVLTIGALVGQKGSGTVLPDVPAVEETAPAEAEEPAGVLPEEEPTGAILPEAEEFDETAAEADDETAGEEGSEDPADGEGSPQP